MAQMKLECVMKTWPPFTHCYNMISLDCVKNNDVSASKLFDRFLCALRNRLYNDPALRARPLIIHHSYFWSFSDIVDSSVFHKKP